jgi:SAM-dependent methyltransferase
MMRLLDNIYVFGVEKFASVLWGLKYNPKKYWTARGLSYRKEFDRSFEKSPGSDRGLSLILGTLKQYEFSSFLDIGCGYGLYLKPIEKEFRLDKIAGCDISSTQIKEAGKYLGPDSKVKLAVTDGEHLPYEDKSFDITFTYGVCIHVPHKKIEAFIKEILRVTRKHYLFIESHAGKDSMYYISHDYPALFKNIGVPLRVIKELDKVENFYIVDL